MKPLICVRLFATPWAVAYQAPPSKGFSRQEYWSGVPLPSPIPSYGYSILYSICFINHSNLIPIAVEAVLNIQNNNLQYKYKSHPFPHIFMYLCKYRYIFWLINSKHLFLIAVEFRKSRIKVKACSLVHRQLFSHCVLTW